MTLLINLCMTLSYVYGTQLRADILKNHQTLISQKLRARVVFQNTRFLTGKRYYNGLALKLKRLLANYRLKSDEKYLSLLTYKYSILRKVSKKILHTQNPPPTLHNDGHWATSEQDQANLFTKHLENTFQLHYNVLYSNRIKYVGNSSTFLYQCLFFLERFLPAK